MVQLQSHRVDLEAVQVNSTKVPPAPTLAKHDSAGHVFHAKTERLK